MAIYILTDLKVKVTIKEVKKTNKTKTLSDGSGLMLKIKPNEFRWFFRYQSPTKYKRRLRSIGKYPDVTILQARQKAKKWRELITQGIDPVDTDKQKRDEKKRETKGIFSKILDEWFKTQKTLNPRHLKRKKALFENYITPKFKDRPIQSITHDEISVIVERLGKKTPESAKRVIMFSNQLWKYATTKNYTAYNIIADNIDKNVLIKKAPQKHLSKITDETILKDLINALYGYSGTLSIKNALLFTMHLPLRASNVVTLTWDRIDFKKRTVTIPRNEMKNKDPNLPALKFPLTDEVIKILKDQKENMGFSKWVFPSTQTNKHISQESPNVALRRLGFTDDKQQTMHSFRGTFRSLADTYQDKHNQAYEIKEVALDHYTKNQASLAYSHKADYEKSLKILFDWWSGFILNLRDKKD